MLIISCFSYIVLSQIRHQYSKLKSVQIISRILVLRICSVVAFRTALVLKLAAIAQSLEASTERVTCLHFVKDQQIIFVEFAASTRIATYLIYNKRSLLLVKEASVKIISYRLFQSSFTIISLQLLFYICQIILQFKVVILVFVTLPLFT